MTTASVLFTVTTTFNVSNDKIEKECLGRSIKHVTAEAAKELRESPTIKEQALSLMREWIQQNGDIKNVRTDELFILRFLRHKKYSIPMAQQTLLKYLNLRKYYPEIFHNLSYDEPKIRDILNEGYLVVSPVRDNKGRRVIVYSMKHMNPYKYNCWDLCRAHALVYDSLMEDPVDQMCGFVHVGDGSGATGAHVTAWNPTDFARVIIWGEQSYPMRHKEFHFVNVPSTLKYIIDFAIGRTSPKIGERLKIHTNMKQLMKCMNTDCLPTSFGGPLKLDDMIKYTASLMKEQKSRVAELETMELLNTRGIITSKNNKVAIVNGEAEVRGSFRKLEID